MSFRENRHTEGRNALTGAIEMKLTHSMVQSPS